MKKTIHLLLLIVCFILTKAIYSQSSAASSENEEVIKIFRSDEILPIKLIYSNKNIKKNTNDSTFIKTDLSYKTKENTWETFEVRLRARGNFRRGHCYFPPIKMKIKKSEYKGTLFSKNKTSKLVLPCLKEKEKNDNIIKEYMAYQLYEILAPYHFKTRLLDVDFTEIKKNKTIPYKLKGIIIEDDKKVAKRFNGRIYDKFMHPLNLEDVNSIRNALFQYMIGNTDFSTAYNHNGKLMYVNKKMVPIPYDFDMSGLVDASYAVVSKVQGEELRIEDITQRMYRGFKRNDAILQDVRKEFISHKTEVFEMIDSLKIHFEDPKEFTTARKYIAEFYEIIENDDDFYSKIQTKQRAD